MTAPPILLDGFSYRERVCVCVDAWESKRGGDGRVIVGAGRVVARQYQMCAGCVGNQEREKGGEKYRLLNVRHGAYTWPGPPIKS